MTKNVTIQCYQSGILIKIGISKYLNILYLFERYIIEMQHDVVKG